MKKTEKRAAARAAAGFSEAERAAMRARAKEMRAEARANKTRADGEAAALAAIAAMPGPDRALGKRLHAIITANAPSLWPKTWYGMPSYANEDGKIVCYFQSAEKFKTRYATFGFQHDARLDDGAMWPVAFALKALTEAEEARISALVKKAVS